MKKQIEPFGMNIKNFICGNNISNQDFADELNKHLQEKELDSRIYIANDIWTYYSRASFPRDKKVLVAVAEIIGKPLEDVLLKEFSTNELKNDKYFKSKVIKTENINADWNINILNDLTNKEMNFLYKLIEDGSTDINGKFTSTFDISIKYNGGQSVKATFHWGDFDSDENALEWTWKEYGDAMQEVEEEAFVVKYKLEDEVLNKFYTMGLFEEVNPLTCKFDDLTGDEYENIHGYVVVEVVFKIGKDEIIKIMECYLKILEAKLAKGSTEN